MGSPIIQIGVRADLNGTGAALNSVAENVKNVGTAAASAAPQVAQFGNVNDALIAALNSSAEATDKLHERIESIGPAFDKAKDHARGLGEEISKAENSAEFREWQSSIREAIENPLKAAKTAAEGLFLQVGAAGVAGTALIGLGAAALEVAHSVAETSHGFEKLAIELGIGVEPAQELARTMELLDIDSGSLIMASRTLSRVLEENTKESDEAKSKLQALGVAMRDANTGAFLPFNELLPNILRALSEMTDITERNRLAVELFGRSGLQLLVLGKDFDELRERMKSARVVMDEATNKQNADFAVSWNLIKEKIEAATNALGSWIVKNTVLAAAGAGLTNFPGMDPPKEAPDAYALGQAEWEKRKSDVLAAQIKKNDEKILTAKQEGVDKLKVAEQKLADLKEKLQTGLTDKAFATVNAPVISQIGAQEALIESLKGAEKRQEQQKRMREQELSAAEAHQIALVEIQRTGIDDQIRLGEISQAEATTNLLAANDLELTIRRNFIDQKIAIAQKDPSGGAEVARLQGERVAAEDRAAKQIQDIHFKEADSTKKLGEELARLAERADETAAKQIEAGEKVIEKQGEEMSKSFVEASRANAERLEDHRKAQAEIELGELEHQHRMLELQKSTALEGAKAAGAGLNEQFAILKKYDALLDSLNSKITAARENERAITGSGPESRTASAQVAGGAAKDETAIAEAKELQKEIDNVSKEFDTVFSKINNQFTSAVDSWISGSKRFGVAFREIPRDMLKDWTNSLLQMGLKYIEHTYLIRGAETALAAALKALGLEKAAATVSTAAAAHAAGAPVRIAQVTADAAVGAAGAAAATAQIPYVGPALAPAAAAATFAQIMAFVPLAAFEGGGLTGSSELLALLHPNEMVLPSPITNHIMNSLGSSGSKSDRELHVHYHGYEGQDEDSMKVDAHTMMKHLQREQRLRNN